LLPTATWEADIAYTGHPSTDVFDRIRLLIGDVSTSTGSEIFSDNEIQYFRNAKANEFLSAALAIDSIAGTTRYSSLSSVVAKQVGDLRIDYGQGASISNDLFAKSKWLRLQGIRTVRPYAGGISISDKDASKDDSDRVAPTFTVGQFDYTRSTST
jgi:hypothetical protein